MLFCLFCVHLMFSDGRNLETLIASVKKAIAIEFLKDINGKKD